MLQSKMEDLNFFSLNTNENCSSFSMKLKCNLLCTGLYCILYFLWHRFLVDGLTFVTDEVLTTVYFFAKLEKMSVYFWCKCVYIYLKWNKCRGNIHYLFSVLIATFLFGITKKVEKHPWPWARQQLWGQTQHFHC
jgi:hypothetical protein